MRTSVVLPVMGVLAVVAGALGMHLGESAISQIDPAHYQTTDPPRDVSRDPPPPARPNYAAAYGWDEGHKARAQDCGDCPALVARDAYASVSPARIDRDAHEARWSEEAAALDAELEEVIARPVPRGDIGRYVHYPINQEQAAIARARPVEEPLTTARAQLGEPDGL